MLKKYELPPGYLYRVSNPSERIPGSDLREVVVYRDSMATGLRFPLHPLFVSFFNEFHVTFGQLTPNSWRISTYFLYLCLTNNIEPCLRLFRNVFDMYPVLGRNCYAYIQLKVHIGSPEDMDDFDFGGVMDVAGFATDAEDPSLSPLNKKKRRADKGKAIAETTTTSCSVPRTTMGNSAHAFKEFGFPPVDSTTEAEIMLGCVNEKLIESLKNKEVAAMRRIMYTNHRRILVMEEKVLRDLEKFEKRAADRDHDKKKVVAEVQSLLDKAIDESKKKDNENAYLQKEVDQLRKKLETADDEAIAGYKISAKYKSNLHMYGAESLKVAIKMTMEGLDLNPLVLLIIK
ncbi:Uncharacterized protein Adt_21602 [Abeliophyllum distichum]|uniref:Transposase (putative) gypsy type domain-containing protein n=1 Tax=Abeliophyllum distichum TaxID=126358 RepID=A0ABD1SZT4_9LAMI